MYLSKRVLLYKGKIRLFQVIFKNISVISSVIHLRHRTLKRFLSFCWNFLTEIRSQYNTRLFQIFGLLPLSSYFGMLTRFNSSFDRIGVRCFFFAIFFLAYYKLSFLHFCFHFVAILSAIRFNIIRDQCVLCLRLKNGFILSPSNCKVGGSKVN